MYFKNFRLISRLIVTESWDLVSNAQCCSLINNQTKAIFQSIVINIANKTGLRPDSRTAWQGGRERQKNFEMCLKKEKI